MGIKWKYSYCNIGQDFPYIFPVSEEHLRKCFQGYSIILNGKSLKKKCGVSDKSFYVEVALGYNMDGGYPCPGSVMYYNDEVNLSNNVSSAC